MQNDDFPILPTTKVRSLLQRFPELEDRLIELAPAFKKLKNPVLRNRVAGVASLKHAAAVARMPVSQLINTLRGVVGQPAINCEATDEAPTYFYPQPDWFDSVQLVETIHESSSDPDQMPITGVLQRAMSMKRGEILELVTQHLPAPGIDILKAKGYRVWCSETPPGVIRTFICKT